MQLSPVLVGLSLQRNVIHCFSTVYHYYLKVSYQRTYVASCTRGLAFLYAYCQHTGTKLRGCVRGETRDHGFSIAAITTCKASTASKSKKRSCAHQAAPSALQADICAGQCNEARPNHVRADALELLWERRPIAALNLK